MTLLGRDQVQVATSPGIGQHPQLCRQAPITRRSSQKRLVCKIGLEFDEQHQRRHGLWGWQARDYHFPLQKCGNWCPGKGNSLPTSLLVAQPRWTTSTGLPGHSQQRGVGLAGLERAQLDLAQSGHTPRLCVPKALKVNVCLTFLEYVEKGCRGERCLSKRHTQTQSWKLCFLNLNSYLPLSSMLQKTLNKTHSSTDWKLKRQNTGGRGQ